MVLGLAVCLTVVTGAQPASADVPVTTVAGVASAGSTDGVGSAARFNLPYAVAVNSATGTVYVADLINQTIRAITPGGAVSTLAGVVGSCGSTNGVGSAARFCYPTGVAVNSATGTVYVTDNSTIRAITPGGTVSTLAGVAGSCGSVNGVGSAARFCFPNGVAVNSATGTVYVADTSNNTIRAITPGGAVSTFAGLAESDCGAADGVGSAARFCYPRGVAVNPSTGTVYVADSDSATIRAITPGGAVSTLAGFAGTCGSTNGVGSAARFCYPSGVAVNSATGMVYVVDQAAIRTVTPAGAVSTLAGEQFINGSANGVGSAARFNFPQGVAVNSATGTVYVADTYNHVIRTISPAAVVATFAGLPVGSTDGVGSAARFNNPLGIAVNSATGTVYVADNSNHTIRAITPGGAVSTLAGVAGSCGSANGVGSAARFCYPSGVAVNSATGTVYVADSGNNTIRAITPGGAVSTLAGLAGSCGSVNGVGSAARFCYPTGVAVDGATGMVYVGDSSNNTIRAITPGGTVSTLAGLAGDCGALDGVGSAARFCYPTGVAVNSATGTVYVADSDNSTIRAITPAGAVSTLAGLAGDCDSLDGVGSAARFCNPAGVAVNRGNVYVADTFARTIRLITPAGAVSTLAGLAFESGSADGVGSAARFNYPRGVAVNSATGTVYVADSGNNTIRRLDILAQTSADFDGDGKTDVTVFRPSDGHWFILKSSTNSTTWDIYQWGGGADVPVPGDYDGDGKTDITVYRPSDGNWFIRKSSTNYTTWDIHQWGSGGDRPLPGDFDGDGRADLTVYRPSTGHWFILKSSTNYTTWNIYQWGGGADVPVPGDYDGDGKTDVTVYRPSDGNWFILTSSTNYTAWNVYQWGSGGDVPVPGDYDGDGKADLTVYRPSTGHWFIRTSSTNYTAWNVYQWGGGADVPVPGDYDGDGKTDITVFRPSDGNWFILKSSTNYTTWDIHQWGAPGDIPAVRGR